jgi:cell wall assembly regulator SMI1
VDLKWEWEQTCLWMRIESWLRQNHPARGVGLRPGATAEEVNAAEGLLGVKFPDDLRFAYLRHNGEEDDSCGLLEERRWLPLLLVINRWNTLRDVFAKPPARRPSSRKGTKVRGRQPEPDPLWLPGWIPISDSGGCDYHCIDAGQPGEAGYGQVIDYGHHPGRPVVAPTFADWIVKLSGDLELGFSQFGLSHGLG